MPKNLILLAGLFLHVSVFCQTKTAPVFSKIDKADLSNHTCSYDQNAEAEVLCDVGEFELSLVNGSAIQTLHMHVRIKILTEKGLDFANVKIYTSSSGKNEYVSNVVAATYNIDEAGNVDGYEFESLPKNTRISMEDKSLVVTRLLAVQDGTLSTRITVEHKRPFYTTDEYPMLKEFYKKMYLLLDEQFVIKKKS